MKTNTEIKSIEMKLTSEGKPSALKWTSHWNVLRWTEMKCTLLKCIALNWNAPIRNVFTCTNTKHTLKCTQSENVETQNTSKQSLAACRTDRTDPLKCNVLHKQLHKHLHKHRRVVRDAHFNMSTELKCTELQESTGRTFYCTEWECTEWKCSGINGNVLGM